MYQKLQCLKAKEPTFIITPSRLIQTRDYALLLFFISYVIPRITRALLRPSSFPPPCVPSNPRKPSFPPIYIYPTDLCRGSARSARSSVIHADARTARLWQRIERHPTPIGAKRRLTYSVLPLPPPPDGRRDGRWKSSAWGWSALAHSHAWPYTRVSMTAGPLFTIRMLNEKCRGDPFSLYIIKSLNRHSNWDELMRSCRG